MRLQLGARGVWLPRDERDAVEWRRVQRARNEAPSVVVVLQAVRQSREKRVLAMQQGSRLCPQTQRMHPPPDLRSTALRAARALLNYYY